MSETTTTTVLSQEQFVATVAEQYPWFRLLSAEQEAAAYAEYVDADADLPCVLECMADGQEAYTAALCVAGGTDLEAELAARHAATEAATDPAVVKWMHEVYLPYARTIPELAGMEVYDLCDPGQCVCFVRDMGRLPATGKELDEYSDGEGADAAASGAEDTDLEGQDGDGTDTDTEPADPLGIGGPITTPAPAATVEPTHTVAEYQALLEKYSRLCTTGAELNYAKSVTALQTVTTYLGTHPGKAARSAAVYELARREVEVDPDAEALYPPAGVSPETHLKHCVRDAQKRVNVCVQGGALLTQLFGATIDAPVVCKDGICRKNATKANPALAWRQVRELFPLVRRVTPENEYAEVWELLPYVAEDAKALAQEAVKGLKQADVIRQVRMLCVDSAKKRQAAGDKNAADDVEFWQGKLDKAPNQTAKEPGKSAATEGTATEPVKPQAVSAAAADEPEATTEAKVAPPVRSAGNLVRGQAADGEARDAVAVAVDVWNFVVTECRDNKLDIGAVLSELMTAAKDHDGIDVAVRNTCMTWIKAYMTRTAK